MENDVAVISVEETQDVACDIITVHNVRGYIDANGTAWLNVEDVARGLGFTQTKNGVEYVRWETVNGYLKAFKFSQQVGKDDFIPENMFYRLAMKAKNETAEQFQAKVADEILPELRKHRFYSLDNNKTQSSEETKTSQTLSLAYITNDAIEMSKLLEKYLGVKKGIAYVNSITTAEKFYKVDLEPLKQLAPPADHEIGTLTPTEIGKKINLSAQKVNKKLVELGLQVKDGNVYRLTENGKKYGEAMPFERNGHTDYQIKWTAMVVKLVHGKEEEIILQ